VIIDEKVQDTNLFHLKKELSDIAKNIELQYILQEKKISTEEIYDCCSSILYN
jgi:hypothetical protein